jgi:hypothetical protein
MHDKISSPTAPVAPTIPTLKLLSAIIVLVVLGDKPALKKEFDDFGSVKQLIRNGKDRSVNKYIDIAFTIVTDCSQCNETMMISIYHSYESFIIIEVLR